MTNDELINRFGSAIKKIVKEDNNMLTNEEILKKHIPNGCINLKSYKAENEAILSALEEAREDERNQGRGEGPVWVKADKELPIIHHRYYYIKSGKIKDLAFYSTTKDRWETYDKEVYQNESVEWLKEPDYK